MIMTEREGGTRKNDTAVRKVFGKNLFELRNKAGITRKELAEKLGIARVSISGWENGLRFPTADKLIEIANLLNVSLDTLCGRDEVTDTRAINRYRFDRAVNRLACIGKVFYTGNETYALMLPHKGVTFETDSAGMVKSIDEESDGIYFKNDAALYNFVESTENESLNGDKTFESVFHERTKGRFVKIEYPTFALAT